MLRRVAKALNAKVGLVLEPGEWNSAALSPNRPFPTA
jgi:hypothetical protein